MFWTFPSLQRVTSVDTLVSLETTNCNDNDEDKDKQEATKPKIQNNQRVDQTSDFLIIKVSVDLTVSASKRDCLES